MLFPNLSNDSVRFIQKLDKKQFGQIFAATTALWDNPRPVDSISMGDKLHFRKDVGEYRVIYHFDDKVFYVDVIGNRNDSAAYQAFDRKK
jgi:mRNA-degrading endonuclease RelE of RelBE toxin-antitoxin system